MVPDYMIPFVAILEEGQDPFAMFVDLQNKYDWVLEPVIGYSSVDRLIEVFEDKIGRPAEAKFNQLLTRRTKQLRAEKRLEHGSFSRGHHDHDLLRIVIISFDVSVNFQLPIWGLSDASLARHSPDGLADPAG